MTVIKAMAVALPAERAGGIIPVDAEITIANSNDNRTNGNTPSQDVSLSFYNGLAVLVNEATSSA